MARIPQSFFRPPVQQGDITSLIGKALCEQLTRDKLQDILYDDMVPAYSVTPVPHQTLPLIGHTTPGDGPLWYFDEPSWCQSGNVLYSVSGYVYGDTRSVLDDSVPYGSLPYILRYDLAADAWLPAIQLPDYLTYGPYGFEGGFAEVIGDYLYFGGGDVMPDDTSTFLWRMHLTTHVFERLEDSPIQIDYNCSFMADGKLYVADYDNWACYTPGTGWSEITPLGTAGVLDWSSGDRGIQVGRQVIIPGANAVFNVDTSTFSNWMAEPPYALGNYSGNGHAFAVSDGKMFMFGKYGALIIDLTTHETILSSSGNWDTYGAGGVYNGRFFLLGAAKGHAAWIERDGNYQGEINVGDVVGNTLRAHTATLSGGAYLSLGTGEAAGEGSLSFGLGKATGSGSVSFHAGQATGSGAIAVQSSTASGVSATAFGQSQSTGYFTFGEGFSTASGWAAHAEAWGLASGDSAHAESHGIASGPRCHAEGWSTATGDCSHAEGQSAMAIGDESHAEGYSTTASGWASHAEGYNTNATGQNAHSEGYQTTASGMLTHAEGQQSTASGYCSHAEGVETTAAGVASHAEGEVTAANGDFSHASGLGGITRDGASYARGGGLGVGVQYYACQATAMSHDANLTPLHPPNSSEILLAPGSAAAFKALVVGQKTDHSYAAAWEIKALVRCSAAGTAVTLVNPVVTSIGADAAAAGMNVALDKIDSMGKLRILVTGKAATDIRWSAHIEMQEVG